MGLPVLSELGWRNCGVALVAAVAAYLAATEKQRRAYAAIPTVGGSDLPFLWIIGSIHFFRHGATLLQEGYDKYKDRAFKVPMMHRWVIILPGRELVEEVRRLPKGVMSLREAGNQLVGIEQTLGRDLIDDPHLNIVAHSLLNINSDALYSELQDEAAHVFSSTIGVPDDWKAFLALKTAQKIISALVARSFVGLPLARDPAWTALAPRFALHLVLSRMVLECVPGPFKRFVREYGTPLPRTIRQGAALLAPVVAERRANLLSNAADPSVGGEREDVLTRMVRQLEADSASTDEQALFEGLLKRIMFLSMVAVHATSMILAHALYTIGAEPGHADELRAEVESAFAEHGHTRQAMADLVKMDSFLREVIRFNSGGLTLVRIAQTDYTLADGTRIPKGALLSAAQAPTHHDEANYDGAGEFRPWRFVGLAGKEGRGGKGGVGMTGVDYLPFGHGRYACPGRYFAASLLKLALAHTLLHYDVRTEVPGVRPANVSIMAEQMPNGKGKVLFRARRRESQAGSGV